MILKPISIDYSLYPEELVSFLFEQKIFDSSSSPEATVLYIEKDNGYFLKSSLKGALRKEVEMTNYFASKGLSCEVILYISDDKDWMLTEKIKGKDCVSEKHLSNPQKMVDILAEQLYFLHHNDFSDCPIQNHTANYISTAKTNYENNNFTINDFSKKLGFKSGKEAYSMIESSAHILKTDTLLHGDYCLPNIILNNWKFSGFIDLDSGGVGDRHVDLFWALWTLVFNLKTDRYNNRFIDAYGRMYVDQEILRLIAAIEFFI